MDTDSYGFFSLTQANDSPVIPRIFVDQSGDPIRVFVEATGVSNRPKVIRGLRSAGAIICHSPSESNVILVDSITDAGRQFIRDWNSDPGKVILNDSWARMSLEAGRALLAGENWGGCMARDDGLPIVTKDFGTKELDVPNPFPTPRPTPTEPVSLQYQSSVTDIPSSQLPQVAESFSATTEPNNITLDQLHSHPQVLGSAFTSQAPQTPYNSHRTPATVQPFAPPPFTQQPAQQQFAPVQQFTQQSHIQPHIMAQALVQQQQLAPPQASSQQLVIHQQQPSFQNLLSAMMPFFPQMLTNNMNQPSTPFANQIDLSMMATLFDVVRHHGMNSTGMSGPWGSQAPPQGQTHPPPANTLTNPTADSISSSFNTVNEPSTATSETHRWSPPTVTPPPTVSNVAKGKRKRVVLGNSPSLEGSPAVQTPASICSHGSPYGTPVTYVAEPKSSPPQEQHGIFKNKFGKSLSFFVQIDIKRRLDVVSAIRKNGGKIVSTISSADYVILSRHSTTFTSLLAQVQVAEKEPIQPTFVHDCVERGALLDHSDYILEGSPTLKKRGRQAGTSNKVKARESSPTQKRKAKNERDRERVAKKIKKEREESNFAGERSPSPPPASTSIELSSGKYQFTPEEREYAQTYGLLLLKRDPQISTAALAMKLFHKIPYHSLKSWQSYVSRNELNLNQMYQAGTPSRSKSAAPVNESVEASSSKVASPQHTPEKTTEQEDFEVICHFFASGGGDDSDDEAVWAALEKHKPCRSAISWPEFYQARMGTIGSRIEELVHENEVSGQLTVDQ